SVIVQLEEIELERNLASLLFDSVHAPKTHEHGLKRLLLFQSRIEGNGLAFKDCVAAFPSLAQSFYQIRHCRRVIVEPARIELNLRRFAILVVNLKTSAVVFDFKDNLLALELFKYLARVVNLVRVHKLVWTKERDARAFKTLRALLGTRRSKTYVVGHGVEMLNIFGVNVESPGDCS